MKNLIILTIIIALLNSNYAQQKHSIKSKKSMTFKYLDKATNCQVNILERNEDFIEVELTCIVDSLKIKIENQKLQCYNIDPEGLNSMDFFDPSGNFNPGQVFDGKKPFEMVRIFLPYEEVEIGIEYLGLFIVEKEQNLFEAVLK
jgi:hypothetical protein